MEHVFKCFTQCRTPLNSTEGFLSFSLIGVRRLKRKSSSKKLISSTHLVYGCKRCFGLSDHYPRQQFHVRCQTSFFFFPLLTIKSAQLVWKRNSLNIPQAMLSSWTWSDRDDTHNERLLWLISKGIDQQYTFSIFFAAFGMRLHVYLVWSFWALLPCIQIQTLFAKTKCAVIF